MVRESCDIMGEFSLSLVTTLQSLVIMNLLEEDIKLSICHLTSFDHMIRASYDIMGEFFSS